MGIRDFPRHEEDHVCLQRLKQEHSLHKHTSASPWHQRTVRAVKEQVEFVHPCTPISDVLPLGVSASVDLS